MKGFVRIEHQIRAIYERGHVKGRICERKGLRITQQGKVKNHNIITRVENHKNNVLGFHSNEK